MDNQPPAYDTLVPQYEEYSPEDQPPKYRKTELTPMEARIKRRRKEDIERKRARINEQYRNPTLNPISVVAGLVSEKTPQSLFTAALFVGSLFK